MPKSWHDRHAINKLNDSSKKDLYRSIVADKKPYFMRYIYPSLMKQYNTYIKNTDRNALREFDMTVSEMKVRPYEELSDRQKEFLRYFDMKMPVGTGDCIMNKICRRFEEEFDGHIKKHSAAASFDYRIMKNDSEYSPAQFYEIKKLYTDYNKRVNNYSVFVSYERVNEWDAASEMSSMNEEFRRSCEEVCPDERVLCNIILDMCYTRNSTKKFAWSMCGKTIIQNLLEKNDYQISFPTLDPDGDIAYCGDRYRLQTKRIEVTECQ